MLQRFTWSITMIRFFLLSIAFFVELLFASVVSAQFSPKEHASHHPDQAQQQPVEKDQGSGSKNSPDTNAADGKGSSGGGAGGGGMMGGGGMGGMMEKMGAPKPKEMYPKLMEFPHLTPEQRTQIQQEAHQRMMAGSNLLSQGLDQLSTAAPTDDFAAMQTATSTMREGLAQFESGLAAHRAIAEGKSPQNVALDWFKQEMNLVPPTATAANPTGFTLFGMSPFHSLFMLVLTLFAIAMLWMYFFKMRRASDLLQRLVSDEAGVNSGTAASIQSNQVVAESAPTEAPAKDVDEKSANKGEIGGAKRCCDDPSQPCSDDCAEICEDELNNSGQPDFSRGLLPVARRKLCKLRIARIYQETEDVKTFRLVSCHGGPIPFSYLPGQFLTLKFPVGEKPIRRSYTIASSPTQGYYCEISVKREDKGAGSRYLHDKLKVGDALDVQAPSGKFIFTGKEAKDIVLISGGVGITPMMSITRALTDMEWPGQIYFITACRDLDHFIFESELKLLQSRHANLHVCAALSKATEPTEGYRTGRLNAEMLNEWVPDIHSKRAHICGPVPMMDAIESLLIEMGVAADNIHTENFGSQAKPKLAGTSNSKTGKSKKKSSTDAPTATIGKQTANVEFKTSGKSTPIEPDETLLEAAERVGVDIDNSCRVGMCGMCAVKLLSGEVTQEVDDGLDPDDAAAGNVLACQAKCSQNVVVEA